MGFIYDIHVSAFNSKLLRGEFVGVHELEQHPASFSPANIFKVWYSLESGELKPERAGRFGKWTQKYAVAILNYFVNCIDSDFSQRLVQF